MTNTKKMTKKEMFADIRALILDLVPERDDILEFIDHEIELLNKKSSIPKKPTAKQLENEQFKVEIIAYLTKVDTSMSIKEMQADIPCLEGISNQRITHLLTALIKEKKIVKDYVKRTPYYCLNS